VAIGRPIDVIEEVDPSGAVTTRWEPREIVDPEPEQRREHVRRHYVLGPGFPADDPLRIVSAIPITIDVGVEYEKYEVLVRESTTALIAFDRVAGNGPGLYDDTLLPGMVARADRLEGARSISILFPTAPATNVDLFVYAGRPADAI
jgi:hypothetical protein